MTPEQVRELADTVRERGLTGLIDPQEDALTALTDELLRHLGAPRVPTKISKARLAQIEAACRAAPFRNVSVDDHNQVWWHLTDDVSYWNRLTMRWHDNWPMDHHIGPFPTLRAALEAPVVRRAGCPPVVEFEVEQ